MLQQVISVSLVASMAATPVVSQGIGANMSINGNGVVSKPAVPVLVATPYTSSSSDSTTAVAVGNGLRDRLQHAIGGGDWTVVTRITMNQSLVKWGYSPDQLLPPDAARQMATSMNARMIVMTTLTREPDGHFSAVTRVIGISDDAGQTIKATQAAGQSPVDFGSKLADQVGTVFKAYGDAKACNDQLTTNRAKAADAATKALKTIPNYGFAEYCLGEVEQAKDSTSAAVLQHFRNSLIGDPLSLRTLSQLAIIDQKKTDTAAVVADYQQMITVAPTNQKIAEQAVAVFKQYNRPEAANQVIDAQIKLDPTNPDWPELKGNSCAYEAATDTSRASAAAKFKCAYEAFNTEYTLDQNRGDSLFFQKIIYVAPTAKDSLSWAGKYVQKYPTSTTSLETLAGMYVTAGQTDSAVATVNLLTKIDPTDSKPVLSVVNAMIGAKHPEQALQFESYFQKADESTKNTYAGLLINAVQPLAGATPRPDSQIVALSQAVIDVAPTAPNYTTYGNYFLAVGLSGFLADVANNLRSADNCAAAQAEDALLKRLTSALTVSAASSNANIASFANDLNSKLQPELTFVAAKLKEKCP